MSRVYLQSAGVPYFIRPLTIEVVLITNSTRSAWIYPKGLIDPGYTAQASAAKEAAEEAGVEGELIDQELDEYEYEKWGGICRVKVYPLKVTELKDDWDEKGLRDRMVVSIDDAIERIRPVQREGLKRLKAFLEHPQS